MLSDRSVVRRKTGRGTLFDNRVVREKERERERGGGGGGGEGGSAHAHTNTVVVVDCLTSQQHSSLLSRTDLLRQLYVLPH